MLIKTQDNEILNVFQIAWIRSDPTIIILGVLPPNTGGMNVYYLHEVEVIDPSINFRTVLYQKEQGVMIAHWALIENEWLDDFIDHSASVYDKFLKIIKEEGVVDKDFY